MKKKPNIDKEVAATKETHCPHCEGAIKLEVNKHGEIINTYI